MPPPIVVVSRPGAGCSPVIAHWLWAVGSEHPRADPYSQAALGIRRLPATPGAPIRLRRRREPRVVVDPPRDS